MLISVGEEVDSGARAVISGSALINSDGLRMRLIELQESYISL